MAQTSKSLPITLIATLFLLTSGVFAQNQQGQAAPSPTPAAQQSPQQSAPAEAGGPQGDIGPIAIPKKKDEEPKREEKPRAPKKVEGLGDFSMRVNVPVVTVDVGVLTKDGMFVPGLKQENFRVLEDGVPQTVTAFNQTQAPITAVMLVEFANSQYFYQFQIDSLIASYTFANSLKKDDWIALISYDLRSHILQDFTQDKRAIQAGISSLQPGMSNSSETDLFDSLYDTIDRLETVEGRKYIVLVSSGRDTFSKKNLDQLLKKIQASKDIAIYSVSTGQALRNWAESHGAMRYLCGFTSFNCNIEYLQADNQLQSFSRMTGGKFYKPLFQASFGEAFADIAQTIRNQYTLSYHPTNRAQDGAFRKLKVQLVAPNGDPLKMRDEKGHDVKYTIVSREGYKAKQEVE
ncbi:MAG TPA: VWA domain-containing protein [Candidatus Angelobacter sp.]|nr:VWA domain-containing protein [Candidatus Angelobacter sp.]